MEVRFSASGLAQLLDVIAYIQRNNQAAAVRFRQRVEEALRRLEQFPDSGRHIPEFPELPYREVIIGPYRIFYLVAHPVIWIVGVWHGAQRPDRPDELRSLKGQNRGTRSAPPLVLQPDRPKPAQ